MAVDRTYRIRVETVGDPSGAKATTNALNETTGAMGKGTVAAKDGSKATDQNAISHQALHKMMGLVGQGSKEAQIALTALSGAMMGSTMFGVYALAEGITLLTEHFEKAKQKAVENAQAFLTMWTAGLDQAAEGRKTMEEYNDLLEKMARGHDVVKEKEIETQALMANELKIRKEILEAMMQADLAMAAGDKAEEERIKQRYGRGKEELNLQGQMLDILHKRRLLEEQSADMEEKSNAADLAQAAKALGAPGRAESQLAQKENDERLKKQMEEAKVAMGDIDKLRSEVAGHEGEPSYSEQTGTMTHAGLLRGKLATAEAAEKRLEELQVKFQANRAIIENYIRGMDGLNKSAATAAEELGKANTAAQATESALATMERLYKQNSDALRQRQEIEVTPIIKGAGYPDSPLSQNVIRDIWALSATGRGERMSGGETEMVNALLAGIQTVQTAKGQSDAKVAQLIARLIAEIKDPHVDLARKLDGVMQALNQRKSVLHTLPGN